MKSKTIRDTFVSVQSLNEYLSDQIPCDWVHLDYENGSVTARLKNGSTFRAVNNWEWKREIANKDGDTYSFLWLRGDFSVS